jgi:hypothetical protein
MKKYRLFGSMKKKGGTAESAVMMREKKDTPRDISSEDKDKDKYKVNP